MIEFFKKLFDYSDWPPRWHDGHWTGLQGWLYIIGDLLIWGAYFTLPMIMLRFIPKKEKRLSRLYILLTAFILASGATHLLDVIAFRIPVYRLDALFRFATGILSWVVAFYLLNTMPNAFRLRTNKELEKEIDKRKQVELELLNKNQLLSDAEEIARLGYWQWHQGEHFFSWSDNLFKLFGIGTVAGRMPIAQYHNVIHREDVHTVFQFTKKILKEKKFHQFSFRIVGENGATRQLLARGQVILNKQNEISHITGTFQDITESKLAEYKFQSLLESAPDAMLIINGKGRIQLINKQAEKLFGYSVPELMDGNIEILLPQRYTTIEDADWKSFFRQASIRAFDNRELYGVHKSGREIPISVSLSPLQTEEGVLVSVAIRDITQQRSAELLIRQSNERNRIFVAQTPNALAMFDKDMRYMAASQRWLEEYHIDDKEIIGRSHYDIFPEISEDWKAIHRKCLDGEINTCDEAAFKRQDGSVQWLSWDIRPWYESEKKIGGLLMYTADITALKAKDTEKKKIEDILDKTNEVARIGTWEVILGKETHVQWSRVTKEIYEVPPDYEASLETGILFYKAGINRQTIREALNNAIEHGKAYDLELVIVTQNGHEKWIRAIGQAEMDAGVCKRLYGIFQDIDEKKKAAQVLYEVNEELKAILDAGPISIIGTDKFGTITHFNRGAELLLGYDAAEMIGLHTPVMIHVQEELHERAGRFSLEDGVHDQFEVLVNIARKEAHEVSEWTYVRKNGSTFPVQLFISPIKNAAGETNGFLHIANDISKRKDAEARLKESEQQFTSFMSALPALAWISDEHGNFQYVNPLYAEAMERWDLPGKNIKDIFPSELCKMYLDNNAIVFNTNAIHEVIETSVDKHGATLTFKTFKFPLGKRNGVKILGGIGINISEIIHAEAALKELNGQLVRSNSELEQFAFVASHDLKEPLRMVGSFMQLLEKKYGDALDATAKEYIQIAVTGAKRMNILINDLLSFSKIGSNGKISGPVDMNAVVSKTIALYDEPISSRHFKLILNPLPPVMGNVTQIEQLFQNLVGNAIKYTRDDHPEVEIGYDDSIDQGAFYVKDNGIGIDMKFGEKIFVIFQRLHNKSEYSGTGIGLAICKKIVEQHGGSIWVRSEQGKGSTFYFTFKLS